MNLMVTANQKPMIDTPTKKRERNSKHNTKDSHQITRKESKRRKEHKRTMKTTGKQCTKWQ